MKHGKLTTFTPQEDGSILIRSEGYYDRETPNSIKEEVLENFITSQTTYVQDLIRALRPLQQDDVDVISFEIRKHKGEVSHIKRIYQTKNFKY